MKEYIVSFGLRLEIVQGGEAQKIAKTNYFSKQLIS